MYFCRSDVRLVGSRNAASLSHVKQDYLMRNLIYILGIGLCLLFSGTLYGQNHIDSVMTEYASSNGLLITETNQVKLLMNGSEKFRELFAAIRSARHSVHLEYFNFRNDSIGNELFDLLAEKAAEGVEVRALYDGFGNMSNNKPLRWRKIREIRRNGIQLYEFDPLRFPWFNHIFSRDHRKIVVIDGKIGFTGGMNVADYYINGKAKIGSWHDMHLVMEGPAVEILQNIFLRIWNKRTHQSVGGPAYFPAPDHKWLGTKEAYTKVMVVNREPNVTPSAIRDAYIAAIDAARDSIRLINPYFVPTRGVYMALERALKRGVDLEIMISEKCDVPFTPDAARYKLHRLMRKGAKVYYYKNGFHHTKIMMVDGRLCTVGSANLNSRSLRFDYEDNLFMLDNRLTSELREKFEEDKKDSYLLTPVIWKKLSPWKKFSGWFANLFTFCL